MPCLHDSITRPKTTALPKTVKPWHPFSWRSLVELDSLTARDSGFRRRHATFDLTPRVVEVDS